MEPWQREHIRKNLPELQDFTHCNSVLFAYLTQSSVLDKYELEQLETTKNRFAQSTLLYKILETKVGSYKKLYDALENCKQDGASKILEEGFKKQNIRYLDNPLDILSADVLLQGQVFKLQEILPGINKQVLEDILKSLENQDNSTGPSVLDNNMFVLVKSTIPAMPPIYIPRSISKRKTINPECFKKDCPDVFVFKGIDRVQLNQLVNRPTSESTHQLLEVKSRFIVLENEKDWHEIRGVSKSPTHLVRVEKVAGSTKQNKLEFILEASTGGSSVLFKPSEDERVTIFEDDFIDTINKEADVSGYCICDTPGMGKSLVLANLARKLAQKNPKQIVAFIPLTQLILKDDMNMSLLEQVKKIIGLISPSPFSQAILLWAVMSKSIKLEIFFDGLDEVSFDELDYTKQLLKDLARLGLILRMFVTSRPHLRQELEQTLGVISYDLIPFTRENTVEFLTTFWKQKCSNLNAGKLQTFTTFCLESLEKTCSKMENDIMGIPLQCLLLAEVHAKGAEMFCDSERNMETPVIKSISIYEMYKQFVDLRFNFSRFQNVNIVAASINENADKIWIFHVWKSMELLFPELAESFALLENIDKNIPASDYCSFGLLQIENQTDSFIHRTVAEFLFAEYLVLFLANKSNHSWNDAAKKLLQVLVNHAFPSHTDSVATLVFKLNIFVFNYDVIFYFVNGSLSLKFSETLDDNFATYFVDILQPAGFFQVLQCSVYHNYFYLFSFLVNILKATQQRTFNKVTKYFTRNRNVLDKILKRMTGLQLPPNALIFIAANYSDVDMMDAVFKLFNELFQFDLDYCCNHWKWPPSPLEVAVKRGSYEIVEYLVDKFSFDLDTLIDQCISYSYNESSEKATNKIKICKVLYTRKHKSEQHDFASVNQRICKYFIKKECHAEFYKYFIRESGNVFQTKGKGTIVHYGANIRISANDFHEVCRMLIQERGAASIFQQNSQKWHSPCHWILRNVINIQVKTLEMILDSAEINVNIIDDNKRGGKCNLIQSAVKGEQSLDLIKMLIDRGADCNYKNEEGMTVLHLAVFGRSWAQNVNLEVVKYLISIHDDISVTDHKRRNFLHWAAHKLMDEQFQELTAFILQHPKGRVLLNAKDIFEKTPVQQNYNPFRI